MITLTVEGMTCNNCKNIITKAILDVDKEAGVRVDLSQGLVNVLTHAPAKAIRHVIEDRGYRVKNENLSAPM